MINYLNFRRRKKIKNSEIEITFCQKNNFIFYAKSKYKL